MEQLPLSFTEIIQIVGYFSSLSILIGVAIQAILILLKDKKLSSKMLLIVFTTQILAFVATIILWLRWPTSLRILYGPILFPALIAQLIFVPLVPGFFGKRSKKEASTSEVNN